MTRKGVWDIQDVRDKLLAGDPWLRFNNLYTAGINISGVLGQNNRTIYSSPKQIPGTTWASIAAGDGSAIATKTDGTLWSWGNNSAGSLGLNQPENSQYSSPVQVPGTTWTLDNVYSYGYGIR